MNVETLIAELEPLTHGQRMRRMVEVGWLAVSDSEIAATLAGLERGDVYQRQLALQACYGSRDAAPIMRALTDPSRLIRRLALSEAPLVCDDNQLQLVLVAAARRHLPRLVRRLHRVRPAATDRFIETLAETADERAPRLLPFASATVVAARLPAVLERFDEVAWARLADLHPDLAADALTREVEGLERFDERIVTVAATVLPRLAESRPDRAVALVRSLHRHVPLSRLDLHRLAECRPNEVAEIVLSSSDRAVVFFDLAIGRLDDDLLIRLLERRLLTGFAASWLREIPPERRARFHALFRDGWLDADGLLPADVLAALPREAREQEARRHLTAPKLRDKAVQQALYETFLPWDEALATLAGTLRSPDADLRRAANVVLAGVIRYDRDRAGDLLALLQARRNEQDPVRGDFIRALAKLPPSLWQDRHLEGLGQIVRSALDAVDVSHATIVAVVDLLVRLLPRHPDWAAGWLATVARQRGELPFWSLEAQVNDGEAMRVAAALMPVLLEWETRDRQAAIVGVASQFGRRLRVMPALVEILERVLRQTRDAATADQILQMVKEYAPDRFAAIVPELLTDDVSWIRRPLVLDHLHRRRQDLLTPFLSAPTTPGRFDAGTARYALPLDEGFARWTASQQATYTAMLVEMTGDPVDAAKSALWTLPRFAALPAGPKNRLIELAGLDNKGIAVRDAALQALGRLDGLEGIPVLLEALGDERARLAIYALRRALLDLPAEEALERLRAAPREKITVAKEIVRLIGELRIETAYQELLVWDSQDLHRDVRVALLRALWDWIERDETWPILGRAATAPDRDVAAGVVNIPADGHSRQAQQRLAALLAILLAHPNGHVRDLTVGRIRSSPPADPERRLAPALLSVLDSADEDEMVSAAGAIFAAYGADEPALVAATIARLRTNRRVLATALDALTWVTNWQATRLAETARTVIRALAADRLTLSLRCQLAIHALPADELIAFFADAVAGEDLDAEALMRSVEVLSGTEVTNVMPPPDILYQPAPRFRLNRGRRTRLMWPHRWSMRRQMFTVAAVDRYDADDWVRLETAWGAAPDPRLRRLALAALTASARDGHGWTEDRRARLADYQQDPSPLVAAAAQFTFPPAVEA